MATMNAGSSSAVASHEPILDEPGGPLYTRDEYRKEFDAATYLKEFYGVYNAEPAMHVVLTLLPNTVRRLPKGGRVLDVGSGPTTHVAMCFRDSADEVYLSDFAQESRDELRHWLRNDSNHFDWSSVSRFVSLLEGRPDEWRDIEAKAKAKVKGVFACNVLNPQVVRIKKRDFDVVTTFFCLEAACDTMREYRRCIKHLANLVKPGGYLVIGGLLKQSWYRTGGKCFKCVWMTEPDVFDALSNANIDVNDKSFTYFNHEDIMFIIGRRKLVD